MQTIRIITTKGCEACNIAKLLVERAIRKSKVKINLEIIDCLDENYRHFIKRYMITDYPTIVFIEDDKVLTKYFGTVSVPKLIEGIKQWFK